MRKNLYIYDNRGLCISGNFTRSYDGGDCEEITVEIPEKFNPEENDCGTTLEVDGVRCFLDDCLFVNKKGDVYLKHIAYDGYADKLNIISRNGRKGLSFAI